MARRSKGFIELEWTCPNCETRNKGSEKTCVNCGAPQPDNVQFEAPSEKKFVAEEKASELRERSADIHCGFCGTRNPSTAKTCSQCGADLSEGKARQAGREIDMSAKKLEHADLRQLRNRKPGHESQLPEVRRALAASCQTSTRHARFHSGGRRRCQGRQEENQLAAPGRDWRGAGDLLPGDPDAVRLPIAVCAGHCERRVLADFRAGTGDPRGGLQQRAWQSALGRLQRFLPG